MKILFSILFVLVASVANAQTVPDVTNPTAIAFTASGDHALVDNYEATILRSDGTVLQVLNIGKPTPDGTNTITAPLNVQPIVIADGYSVTVVAKVGTTASDPAVSQNKFNRRLLAVTNVVVKQ